MTELEDLLKRYNETELDEVGIFALIELLISERQSYLETGEQQQCES